REAAEMEHLRDARQQSEIPDPQALETFLESKLNLSERGEGIGKQLFDLHGELLALRRRDEVLRRQDRQHMRAIAASEQLLLVHLHHGREERLIVANFGVAIDAMPLAAGVPRDLMRRQWRTVMSTEERRFGGSDERLRFDAGLVSLSPYTVAWLEARPRALPRRVLDALSSVIDRIRQRR